MVEVGTSQDPTTVQERQQDLQSVLSATKKASGTDFEHSLPDSCGHLALNSDSVPWIPPQSCFQLPGALKEQYTDDQKIFQLDTKYPLASTQSPGASHTQYVHGWLKDISPHYQTPRTQSLGDHIYCTRMTKRHLNPRYLTLTHSALRLLLGEPHTL